MNLIDMGRKSEGPSVAEGKKESKVSYPGFSITGDKIPQELRDAGLGGMCRLEIVVRKMGSNIDTYAEGEPERVEVEIHKLGYIGKAGKLSKEEYLAKSEEERDKYDKESMETENQEGE